MKRALSVVIIVVAGMSLVGVLPLSAAAAHPLTEFAPWGPSQNWGPSYAWGPPRTWGPSIYWPPSDRRHPPSAVPRPNPPAEVRPDHPSHAPMYPLREWSPREYEERDLHPTPCPPERVCR